MPTRASSTGSVDGEKTDARAMGYMASSEGKEEIEQAGPPVLTPEQEKKLWRKVDLRILPILTIMYLCSFMDRGNIGNAKLQGLTTQLNLTGHKYNIALTMYFIPYCIFGVPANLVLKKFRPSRWLTGITIVWGIIMQDADGNSEIASILIVFLFRLSASQYPLLYNRYPQLVGVRILLGISEAGLFPGYDTLVSAIYASIPDCNLRGGATLAGAFSGLFAYGISFMSGTAGLLGWSWIFILEGILTVIVGLAACFILVDFPDTAKFLTEDERAFLMWRKKYDNSSVGEEERFEIRHLKAAVLDWQIWMQIVVYFGIVVPLYGISLFLPSIINSFGYNTAISELLTVPPYVCGVITLIVFAVSSDMLQMRSPFILAGLMMCLIGYAINISDAPVGVKYFGTFFCVSGAYSALPGIVAWLGNNLAGQYKRAAGMGIQIGIGNFAGAIASNIYLSQDAPRYILGHAIELMFVGIGLVFLPLTVLAYKWVNKRRDIEQRQLEERGVKYSDEELRRMGDRAPDFRYTL
ncbi:MFS general substrate transporter [Fomitopsis serialis]|uniref:MFS general substrate transporter n=1 Tax=Fomitopsis serialis TaxID=139415 RepID=UPI002007790C|nr:MFS general substrate transporter [Neoantrodia serialis]KAH9919559.1 MFS general substrate transporter [Neoantrodia serialis]